MSGSTLPPVLRDFPVARVLLEPPARETGSARDLYPIRMTLALVAILLFAALAILLWLFGETRAAALVGGAALPLITATTLLLRRGRPRLAIALGTIQVFALMVFVHLSYGFKSGTWLYALVLGLVAHQVSAPREWSHRLLPMALALVGCILPLAFPELVPWRRLEAWQLHSFLAFNLLGTLYAVLVVSSHAALVRDHARAQIAAERDRADALLRNILPEPIVQRLKANPGVIADAFDQVSVLFADIVGFTPLSAQLSSESLVLLLNEIFSAFDALAAQHRLEKIKTIGDAYMVVSGLPQPRADHAQAAVAMALDMRQALTELAARTGHALELRIGIHSGSVVAGVIGKHKFAYDLWGDTVNIASRMESHGAPGTIHISDATRALLPQGFALEARGAIAIKGKGEMQTWFVRS